MAAPSQVIDRPARAPDAGSRAATPSPAGKASPKPSPDRVAQEQSELEEKVARLQAPTPKDRIKIMCRKVKDKGNGSYIGQALSYADARFTMQRLDEVMGPFGWQTEVREVSGIVCVGIGIKVPRSGAWVWKWDTGMDPEAETSEASDDPNAYKGVVSGGLKRAGVQWGIARDLYSIPKKWLPCSAIMVKGELKFQAWLTAAEDAERSHKAASAPPQR